MKETRQGRQLGPNQITDLRLHYCGPNPSDRNFFITTQINPPQIKRLRSPGYYSVEFLLQLTVTTLVQPKPQVNRTFGAVSTWLNWSSKDFGHQNHRPCSDNAANYDWCYQLPFRYTVWHDIQGIQMYLQSALATIRSWIQPQSQMENRGIQKPLTSGGQSFTNQHKCSSK